MRAGRARRRRRQGGGADHPGLDRARAFPILGERIEELGGLFRTAGDLGTTAADLAAMAARCRFVHTGERGLAAAVARGLAGCVAAAARVRGAEVAGLRVAIQGAGAIGSAVAHELAARGAAIVIADVTRDRAAAVAARVRGAVVAPDAILDADVDVLAPCAVGGVLDEAAAARVRAWAVCGAANNLIASPAAARVLHDRGVLVVPDVLASAGAVVDGIGASVMGLANRGPLIDGLADTAAALLAEAAATGRTTTELATERARARIAAARAARSKAPGNPERPG